MTTPSSRAVGNFQRLAAVPPRDAVLVEKTGISTMIWWRWFFSVSQLFSSGFSGTIATAPLTAGGTPGSITFLYGVVVAQTPAT